MIISDPSSGSSKAATRPGKKRGTLIETLRFLQASQAATQPVPYALSLNFGDVFRIQQVRNPFTLNPVSFSTLAAYLECPGCALDQRRHRRPKEPKHFSTVHQATLFGGGGEPDARLVGTLLHTIVNFLHDSHAPLSKPHQQQLLTSPAHLAEFIHTDLVMALRVSGKIKLANFLDSLLGYEETLHRTVVAPMLRYLREMERTGDVVIAASERFQFKLLSTGRTFDGHADWGGYVGLVGEFDQLRLRRVRIGRTYKNVPAIMEFKKGLGRTRKGGASPPGLFVGSEKEKPELVANQQPTPAHALQLMVYWLAFQTRWDVMGEMKTTRGLVSDIRMPLNQELDMILYNLNDGCQYQLVPTNHRDALVALTNCIFHLNWAMKSGYAQQSPEHECRKTQLIDMPRCDIQVGYTSITAEDCYTLARESFTKFKETIRWQLVSNRE